MSISIGLYPKLDLWTANKLYYITFAVEGKTPGTVNFENWRHSVSSSVAASGEAIPQWTENISSYWWDSDDD
jgi:hypothetical protein